MTWPLAGSRWYAVSEPDLAADTNTQRPSGLMTTPSAPPSNGAVMHRSPGHAKLFRQPRWVKAPDVGSRSNQVSELEVRDVA